MCLNSLVHPLNYPFERNLLIQMYKSNHTSSKRNLFLWLLTITSMIFLIVLYKHVNYGYHKTNLVPLNSQHPKYISFTKLHV